MTQETYRFAYEEANAELREILGQFDVLRARKEQMEQVVEALKVVLSGEAPAASIANLTAEQVPFLVHHQTIEVTAQELKGEPAPEPSFEPEPAYAEQSADPFQRR
ncbi:MAG TPA: hypothetical protein VKT75_16830, partial [Acidobacteriaceae bacterium]|nr:hypothetical protein [Acidobacteriaceae bacterium]